MPQSRHSIHSGSALVALFVFEASELLIRVTQSYSVASYLDLRQRFWIRPLLLERSALFQLALVLTRGHSSVNYLRADR
jgi:hypothetical protein